MEHNVLDVEKTKNLLYDAYLYFVADSSELDVFPKDAKRDERHKMSGHLIAFYKLIK